MAPHENNNSKSQSNDERENYDERRQPPPPPPLMNPNEEPAANEAGQTDQMEARGEKKQPTTLGDQGDNLIEQEQEQEHFNDHARPSTIKSSRSLSIIIGDHNHGGRISPASAVAAAAVAQLSAELNQSDHLLNRIQAQSQQHQMHQQQQQHNNKLQQRSVSGKITSKAGHQLHAQYSMPCSLNQRRPTSQQTYQIHHSLVDERIVYCQLSLVSKKDFSSEVRALLDVRKFVTDSFILTDVCEVRIGAILETIIERLVECRQLGHQVSEEAKTLLLLERNSLDMVLANTMQGLYKSRSDGRIAYDHSWIVATCSLNSLHKRQVAITRFPQPVNFGRQSQEVRFLIVVLAPSKEKLTKSAWETGRTFATMFTDIEFRRRLLRAKNQEEIKMELLVRAETLACESSFLETQQAGQQQHQHEAEPPFELQMDLEESGKQLQRPINSIDLFNRKLLQRQQAELNKRHEQLRAALQQAGQHKKSSLSVASSSSGKHFNKQQESTGAAAAAAAACCGCLPDGLKRRARHLGSGLLDDLKRRSRFYLSDYTDGFLGERSLYKTVSTTIFLYFSVLLPCIAFGVVDTNNTDGAIDPKKTMVGQALGGLLFAVFSGQPLIVLMTTAPLCIYVKVIYQISQDLEVDFNSFYACVGLWMALFLLIMSLTNSSNLMKHCTRSTEDIFALFTAFAFGSDGIKEAVRSFRKFYWEPDCLIGSGGSGATGSPAHVLVARNLHDQQAPSISSPGSGALLMFAHNNSSATPTLPNGPPTTNSSHAHQLLGSSILQAIGNTLADHQTQGAGEEPVLEYHHQAGPAGASDGLQGGAAGVAGLDSGLGLVSRCQRETCVLFLFLMCGTLWLANSFNSFDRTPYLSSRKREIIKDYALAISVLIFSFIGSYLFADIRLSVFEFSDFTGLHLAPLPAFNLVVWATAGLLGFMASVLFYIDQNICGAMVNNAPYKLRKGNYFHLDLLVLAVLNTFLSLTGLPWMHGKLPHSHLHSKALADYEERVDEGHIHQIIVNIRETRLTGILVSLLIGLSLLAVPYPLSYIPLPVLSGVFLYTALAEFKSNSMVERICLLFTEQVAYPPNHYIRRCPQRKIHLFTLTQIVQLALVSFIGFYPNPYVNMAFPLAVATFVPIRELFLPKLINSKYLNSLDSASLE